MNAHKEDLNRERGLPAGNPRVMCDEPGVGDVDVGVPIDIDRHAVADKHRRVDDGAPRVEEEYAASVMQAGEGRGEDRGLGFWRLACFWCSLRVEEKHAANISR